MKILRVNSEFVEVLWIDDNEIEYIPVSEFIDRFGQARIDEFFKK